MPGVALRAHFDGERILLDEPYPIAANSRLIVTVLPEDQSFDAWRESWLRLSATGIARAYGNDEPEYTAADLLKE